MSGGFEPISDIINRIFMNLPGEGMLDDTGSLDLERLNQALEQAHQSPDPDTKVGAVITTPSGRGLIATGCNRLPFGIQPTRARLYDRETKLNLMVHAELNAVLTAARSGHMTAGGTIYIAATDDSGLVWGGPPCFKYGCCHTIIQSGIRRIVTFRKKSESKWLDDFALAHNMLAEAGIEYVEVPRV